MGTRVLDPGVTNGPGLHVYVQCLRGKPGGIALRAINTDRTASHTLLVPVAGERYTLTGNPLEGKRVRLNGTDLVLSANDDLLIWPPLRTRLARSPFRQPRWLWERPRMVLVDSAISMTPLDALTRAVSTFWRSRCCPEI